MLVETILASTVIAAGVSGFISVLVSERRIEIKNITQERAKWREEVRKVSRCIHEAIISRNELQLSALRSQFRLLVDPHDPDDIAIVNWIRLPDTDHEEQHATEFAVHVSLMLKFDWMRAKFEADPFWRKYYIEKRYPKRMSFEEYMKTSVDS